MRLPIPPRPRGHFKYKAQVPVRTSFLNWPQEQEEQDGGDEARGDVRPAADHRWPTH
jgi:hypothetical protein